MNSVKYNWGRSVALLLVGLVLVQAKAPLRLNSDGSFKIMFITDLHIGESESNDLKTQGTIQAVLELEKPNFVVLGGDTFSNYAKTAPSPKPALWVQTQWLKAVQPLMGKAEWAAVLGNHDQGTEMNANDISKFDSDLQGSHTVADDSMGDYALPILDSNGQEIVTRLFMFNSQSAGLEPWQVDRYLQRSEILAKTLGRTVPSMAFVHIPLREVYDLYNDGVFRGKMRDRDGVCYQATDLFSALQSRGEVKVITFGHDHGNDFVGNWKGIQLAYGKKTGESAYNELLEGQVLASKGARIFKIQIHPPGGTLAPTLGSLLYSETRRDEKSGNELYNLSIHSWIRTADGEIDEQKELAKRAYSRLHKNCTGPIDPLVWFGVVVGVLVLISCILIVICRWRNCRPKSKTSANFVLITSDNEEAHDLQKLA